ncbi:sensor histidine kinase [Staphylococcus devriesei]|nr:sensor histidine kinase [Staphylococcus devriesei]PTF01632.1 sensor histidine kinase [Staphylococcus devriesei]
MENRSWSVRLGEISTLIYLIFPVIGIFGEKRGPEFLYITVLTIFTISYLLMVLVYNKLATNILYALLVLHYLGIIYFVYSVNPMISLFFFFSAFALPFTFDVTLKSKEFITFIITMTICFLVSYYLYESTIAFSILIFYFVILTVTLGNFKTKNDRKIKKELEEKNKYINVLIAEQERNRIAQDLHDTLGHVFASISLKSELAIKLIDSNPETAKQEIININDISKETLNKVRNIIENLKVQNFEEEVKSIENILKDANIAFEFKNKKGANSLNPAKQSLLAMILREAVNNVIKHAHASSVKGEIEYHTQGIKLTISDNGVGIKEPTSTTLKSINDRVKLLNGTLKVTSNKGMTLNITIPREGVK